MATNTLLTIDMITREALRIMENNLTFAKGVNREYDDRFAVTGAKTGDSLRIRKPPKYTGRTAANMSIENTTETYVTLQLTKQFGVDVSFTTKELTLSIDDFSDRVLRPMVSRVANEVDYDGLALYKSVYNSVGVPGTVPDEYRTYLLAGGKLNDEAAPFDPMRSCVISSDMQIEVLDALKGLPEASREIAEQYRRGRMSTAGGMDWAMDQNVNTHTVGAWAGVGVVDGGSQTGASLVTKSWTGGVTGLVKAGDVITLEGVYAVNPITGVSTGKLRQFVVTADANSAGPGTATFAISPSITISGAYKTVTGSPADLAVITVLGAASTQTPQGLVYHRDAFALGMADLEVPQGVHFAGRISDKQLGISVRIVRQYTIDTDTMPCRVDVLYGWKAVRPEWACRVAS